VGRAWAKAKYLPGYHELPKIKVLRASKFDQICSPRYINKGFLKGIFKGFLKGFFKGFTKVCKSARKIGFPKVFPALRLTHRNILQASCAR
jgi:hypothetical protein